ncbi:enoyl-CoA hydratase/isomerase family protein [Chelativorans sp. Marseille-P2723]|uniref:enoyl-CoA hydratase/isomerase family protein n=1 Tax=Chelativorans sp. Marseille-P2723 TaxID=2709133 RepID=UPI001570C99C|nr:enoyl-CoA hydratase/isomerase family protein [Chelativorans sp. Marseille-P2723]
MAAHLITDGVGLAAGYEGPVEETIEESGEILLERRGRAGVITLNRPAALNALNYPMIHAISRALDEWEKDDAVKIVIIKAEGRAFSAGGDLMEVYRTRGSGKPPISFFADEYRLNAAIARYCKPYIALIDGIVMGGGVGVSFHGSHRVVTERMKFAMPEVGIGFFPDVGGSYLLSRQGAYGMYLGLTGNRVGWGDALGAGLATHAVKSADLPNLLDRLVLDNEPDRAIEPFAIRPEWDEARFYAAQRHFSHATLEECLASLSRASGAGDPFAQETLATIMKNSPTSIHVAFRQIRQAAGLSMEDCMRMEFRIVNRMLVNNDFYEGIRATIIDRTSAPEWKPASLYEVETATIDSYFAPLAEGDLQL